jgi:long-chain acyl-CoA synthetase
MPDPTTTPVPQPTADPSTTPVPAAAEPGTGAGVEPTTGAEIAPTSEAAVPTSPPAALSYDEAVAAATAPGQAFETTRMVIDGIDQTVFVHAPPSLRELFATCRTRGDATFLVYADERWGFDRYMAEVDALATALVERYGIEPGDRVAIAMRNLPEWVVAFGAAVSIGAISVSLNGWWTADELDYALGDSTPKVLLADPERAERTVAACAERGIALVVARPTAALPVPEGADAWEDVVGPARAAGAGMPDVDVTPDHDATILYTSGTTGRPKGAVSTHRAVTQSLMAFGCRAAVARLRATSSEAAAAAANPPVFILIVPLFHVTGCVPVTLSCVASGLKLVIMRKWDPGMALEHIEREQVTTFVGVPTQSWDLLEHPRFAEYDTSSLVSVGGGGAPAPPELVRRVEASFSRGRPSIGYGMTETNAYGPQNAGDDYVSHPTSTGRAVSILEISVRTPDGTSLPVGERGEICFKGPHLIRGYWNRPEATTEALVDGWLRTGDLGHLDDEGFVYVEDRVKDMVLRGGENVYCVEVEAAIYEHPSVHEAAVFGVHHERLGEEVAAAVVPRAGVPIDTDDLRRFLAERIAGFKIPSRWLILDQPLPRNAAGKFLKQDLRAQVADIVPPAE